MLDRLAVFRVMTTVGAGQVGPYDESPCPIYHLLRLYREHDDARASDAGWLRSQAALNRGRIFSATRACILSFGGTASRLDDAFLGQRACIARAVCGVQCPSNGADNRWRPCGKACRPTNRRDERDRVERLLATPF